MERSDPRYQAYVEILIQQLIQAMGLTETIALAYAAARAREVLGALPESVQLQVSGSIIKNVKSVIVPNTDGMKGIEAAAAAGIVGGQADKALEVIAAVTADQKAAMRTFLKQVPVTVKAIDNGFIFDIIVTLQQGSDSAVVRIDRVEGVVPEGIDREFVARVIDAAFAQRRKTIRNSMSANGFAKDVLDAAFEACGIAPTTRAETLDVAAFVRLAQELSHDA